MGAKGKKESNTVRVWIKTKNGSLVGREVASKKGTNKEKIYGEK